MKILIHSDNNDYRFHNLVSCLSKLNHQIGFASGEIDKNEFLKFAPNIIIHNIEDKVEFPVENLNAVCIAINDLNSPSSFSLNNPDHERYIKSFVTIKNSTSCNTDMYKSDIVYIGNPYVFKNALRIITNSDWNFKFFHHNPIPINGYCGLCKSEDYHEFYKHSKASIIVKEDQSNRLNDIIFAGGNPVIYDNDVDDFISKLSQAIEEGVKFDAGISKEYIIDNDTNYDRMAKIFTTTGLTKLAKEITAQKKELTKRACI